MRKDIAAEEAGGRIHCNADKRRGAGLGKKKVIAGVGPSEGNSLPLRESRRRK